MPISFDVRSTEIADSEVRLFKRLRTYCEGAAIAVVILAGTVLLGWVFGIAILKSVVPGLVTMKVNTALGLALSAISLWLLLPGAVAYARRPHRSFPGPACGADWIGHVDRIHVWPEFAN
jgi:hypothetical protein